MKISAVPVYLATVALLQLALANSAIAQVSADGSLSTTVNSADGQNFAIDGGDRVGGNLFHSFREFSVPIGGSAAFNNAVDVQNIFSRVTGGNASTIDGLLRANGRTNLFLLNPNGIVFGRNAQLYIGGSFIGSTANRLRFSDGTVWDAASTAAPLLTVSVPVGLQFTTNNPIRVNGSGNQEIVPTTNFGLAVAPGQTFALVGGDVVFDGGIATTAAGRLEIGAVRRGEVSLTPSLVGWALDYGQVEQFGDVQLINRSSLWQPLSSTLGGIQVQGQSVALHNSQIAAIAGGNPLEIGLPGGNIQIEAAGSLEVGGTNGVYPFSSWIVNQVAPGASNAGGQIQINTPLLNLTDGARVQTLSQGSGGAGNIQVNANIISIRGSAAAAADPIAQDLFNSRITSDAIATGNGGDVKISAQRINLSAGGQIATLVAPQATGQRGNIFVNATETIRAIGVNPFNPTLSSGLSSSTVGAGNGGEVKTRGDRFIFLNGGMIQSQTLGTGRAGNVTVRATDTIMARGISAALQGGVVSYTIGAGNSGNITLSTTHLRLYEGSNIGTGAFSRSPEQAALGGGKGGNITINARQSIDLVGVERSSVVPSAISSSTTTPGRAGNVNVLTRRLTNRQGGSIISGTLLTIGRGVFVGTGTGNSGNVRVNAAEWIRLQGIDEDTELSSTIDTYSAGRGNAGTLAIETPQLIIQSGAALGSLTSATGRAGRVTLSANDILVSGIAPNQRPAEIFATARISEAALRQAFNLPDVPTGDTGTLTINADRITIANGGRINVQHQGIGNAGQLRLNTSELSLQNQGNITAATASGQGGNLQLNVRDRLLLRDRSQISTTARGTGSGGNIQINGNALIGLENSDILAQAQAGQGGNIDIAAQSVIGLTPQLELTSGNDINASSQLGVNGTIAITTPSLDANSGLISLPTEVVDSSQQIANRCASAQENQFVVTGRGGVPVTPETLSSDRPWSDLRDLSAFGAQDRAIDSALKPAIQEAGAWQRNSSGQVELVAIEASPSPELGHATCAIGH
jgi:filamentous hemagglutinin family protein